MCDSVGSPLFNPLIQDLSGYDDDSDSSRFTTIVSENEITNVDVPEIISPLSGNAMGYLTTMVDPLQDSSNHGMDLYIGCIDVVYHLAQDDQLYLSL